MHLVDEDDLEWTTLESGETAFKRKQLGEATESDLLGCSLYELPSERSSWPYHYHTANEEAIYVLDGNGTLRLDGETHGLEAGVYVSLPADESGGHRVINDSEGTLRYLVVSTMNEPDLTVYPDSGKFGVYVGSPPGKRGDRSLEGYYDIDEQVDYWESE